MWLLDVNMDVHLVGVLMGLGIACDTTMNRGWSTLSKGELFTRAVAADFPCLFTRDRLFGVSAARALKTFAELAVVIANVPQPALSQYR